VVEFNDDLLYWGRTKIQFNEFSGMGKYKRQKIKIYYDII